MDRFTERLPFLILARLNVKPALPRVHALRTVTVRYRLAAKLSTACKVDTASSQAAEGHAGYGVARPIEDSSHGMRRICEMLITIVIRVRCHISSPKYFDL